MARIAACALSLAVAGCGRIGFDSTSDIAFVQAKFQSTAGSSISFSFDQPIGAGNLIVIALNVYQPADPVLTSITDSAGNHYTMMGQFGRAAEEHYFAYAANTAAGDALVQATMSGATNLEIYAVEYAGLAPAAPLDAFAFANGSSLALDGMQSGEVTITSPVELLFGYGEITSGSGTNGTGFALRSNAHGNVVEDRTVTAPGAYQAIATSLDGPQWTMMIAAFRPR